MPLSGREQMVLNEIREWENQLYSYEANDLERSYEQYLEYSFSLLPEQIQGQVFSMMDSWMFHLHALIQGSQLQLDAKERILSSGRIFQKDIDTLQDMNVLTVDQLSYIAKQHIARHRMYSLAQGGATGTGGIMMLGSDIPAMAVINLRVVQLIAMTYGVEVNTPFEMMSSLKVFHAATLPRRIQGDAWDDLMNDLEQHEDLYFYEGKEDLTDITWIEQPMKQMFKGVAIVLLRKKTLQGIPVISMAIGAGTNYQLTRNVTDFAHKYYQYRYLINKSG